MSNKMEYSQQEVIAGLRARNPKVVKHFCQKLKERVYKQFQKHYGAHHLSWLDDSLSEAFIIILDKVDHKLPEKLSFDNYAFGIVKFSFYNLLRKSSKEPTLPQDNVPEQLHFDRRIHTTAFAFFDWEGYDLLLQWYQQLSDRDQQLLDLRSQGFSNKEIAKELKLADGTVRNVVADLIKEAKGIAA
ncbi:MAG: sigma-70 family RNA polymerase sigma factor [Saprospiraceae bacterium]